MEGFFNSYHTPSEKAQAYVSASPRGGAAFDIFCFGHTVKNYKNSIAYTHGKSEAGFSDLAVIIFRYAQTNQIYR